MCEFISNINWELIIASIAILVSAFSIFTQRKHNKLTFKPIPVVVKYNYTNVLRVKIWNKGTGPLIIKSLAVKNKNSLIDLMPIETREFTFVEFIDNFKNRAISPNDSLNMLEFKLRTNNKGEILEGYEGAFSKIRNTLDGLKICIEYTDIYGNLMNYTSDSLVFGKVIDKE